MAKTTTGGRGGTGTRGLHTKIKKKAGTIKESSRRWLERHINDPYVQRSKADGYRSRAAYKLIEIDDRYKILKKVSASSIWARLPVAGARLLPALSARRKMCRLWSVSTTCISIPCRV